MQEPSQELVRNTSGRFLRISWEALGFPGSSQRALQISPLGLQETLQGALEGARKKLSGKSHGTVEEAFQEAFRKLWKPLQEAFHLAPLGKPSFLPGPY